jgi:hypothetical protein
MIFQTQSQYDFLYDRKKDQFDPIRIENGEGAVTPCPVGESAIQTDVFGLNELTKIIDLRHFNAKLKSLGLEILSSWRNCQNFDFSVIHFENRVALSRAAVPIHDDRKFKFDNPQPEI